MKFYIYISETKVNMLCAQIPKKFIRKIAKELKIDINVLFVKAGVKIAKNQSEESLYAKVNLIEKYIEQNNLISPIDQPQLYFRGCLPMRWGPYKVTKGGLFFGGTTENTIIGLSGSTKHLVTLKTGTTAPDNTGTTVPDFFHETGVSEPPYIEDLFHNEVKRAMGQISEEEEYLIPNPRFAYPRDRLTLNDIGPEILVETQWLATSLEGLTERVEFLAVKLAHGPITQMNPLHIPMPKRGWANEFIKKQKSVLLGSPIYVARTSRP